MRIVVAGLLLLSWVGACGQQNNVQPIPDCSLGVCAGTGVPTIACNAGQKYTQVDLPGTNYTCTGYPPHWVQDTGSQTVLSANLINTALGFVPVSPAQLNGAVANIPQLTASGISTVLGYAPVSPSQLTSAISAIPTVTSSNISTALGYAPVSPTQLSSAISAIPTVTSSNIATALGYTPTSPASLATAIAAIPPFTLPSTATFSTLTVGTLTGSGAGAFSLSGQPGTLPAAGSLPLVGFDANNGNKLTEVNTDGTTTVIGGSGGSGTAVNNQAVAAHQFLTSFNAPNFTAAQPASTDLSDASSLTKYVAPNVQTASYTVVGSDNGNTIEMNCTAACSVTLPTPPAANYRVSIDAVGAITPTVILGSGNFNSAVTAPLLSLNQRSIFYTDGTNWFGDNWNTLTAKVVSGVAYSAMYPGTSLDQRVNACIQDAEVGANGAITHICSSYGEPQTLSGNAGIVNTINVGDAARDFVNWELPASCQWSATMGGTFTGTSTSGTNTVTITSGVPNNIAVGNIINATGLTTNGVTITAISGTTLTLSANSTSTGSYTFTYAANSAIMQWAKTRVHSSGNVRGACNIENASINGGVKYFYSNNGSDASAGYYQWDGVSLGERSGGTLLSNIVMLINGGVDNSTWENFIVTNYKVGTTAIMLGNDSPCCAANLRNMNAYGNDTGGSELVINGGGGPQGFGISNISLGHSAPGVPIFSCNETSTQPENGIAISNWYEETSFNDTTTIPNQITKCSTITVHGMAINNINGATTNTAPAWSIAASTYPPSFHIDGLTLNYHHSLGTVAVVNNNAPNTNAAYTNAGGTLSEYNSNTTYLDTVNAQTYANLPLATTSLAGVFKPDGTSITCTAGGVCSASGGGGGGASYPGIADDGTTITYAEPQKSAVSGTATAAVSLSTGTPYAGTGATSCMFYVNNGATAPSFGTGGCYFGVNEPASGNGFASDFLDLWDNGTSVYSVSHGGGVKSSSTMAMAGLQPSVTAVSASTTLDVNKTVVLCDATAGNVTVTLPASVSSNWYVVKKKDASANTCIVSGGATNIDGATTTTLTAQYQSVRIFGATQWWIF